MYIYTYIYIYIYIYIRIHLFIYLLIVRLMPIDGLCDGVHRLFGTRYAAAG